MNSIFVSLKRDEDDDAIEVRIEVVTDQFRGNSSAWFSIQKLSRKLSLFEAFPIDLENAPTIAGGYWNDDASKIVQEHVHISVKPLDKRGGLVMTIRLFEPYAGQADKSLGQGLHCDCIMSYEGLKGFCDKIRTLMSGATTNVEFDDFVTFAA